MSVLSSLQKGKRGCVLQKLGTVPNFPENFLYEIATQARNDTLIHPIYPMRLPRKARNDRNKKVKKGTLYLIRKGNVPKFFLVSLRVKRGNLIGIIIREKGLFLFTSGKY